MSVIITNSFSGDRSGKIHLGFNQSLYFVKGYLPCNLAIYRGAETTLQGELRANKVTVHVEGVLKNVENMTVINGGMFMYIFYSFMTFDVLFLTIIPIHAFTRSNAISCTKVSYMEDNAIFTLHPNILCAPL